MSVSARVVVREVTGVIRVPTAAVSDFGQNSVVMVRRADRKLQRRVVELGLQGAHTVEIRSGLRAGERVFVPSGG
jgi:multidrug efflux pump subunit AcrA (membrane-fusion protein)